MNMKEDIVKELQKEKELDRFKEIENKLDKIYDYISNNDLGLKEPEDLSQDNLTKVSKEQNFNNFNLMLYSKVVGGRTTYV